MPLLRFLLMAVLFVPLGASAASTINPPSGNAWDLYVYGNAYVVEQILIGIKLIMGGTSPTFKTILLFMAIMGFVVLAIAAGFNPSKNLTRMFTYILAAWGISYASTQLNANVFVTDLVDSGNVYLVPEVPAIVALPAVVTSEIGRSFATLIETNFAVIGSEEFTVTKGGQFNLFSKMVEESSQYVLTSPELKKTFSAYMGNCVVPTIALGKMSVKELTSSPDMMAELEKAGNEALLTPYYAPSDRTALPAAPELGTVTLEDSRGMGALMSCANTYQALKQDVQNGAADLLTKGGEAWKKMGVFTPFDVAFSSMLAKASVTGGGGASGFSSPAGYIMQQSMLGMTSGAFRQAAIQTGNSEMVQAAALSQAEQQQKSAWVAGFAVFNNMMGYVFTLLQSLIYAMTPFIVIALMVPGMGSKIFVNYAQVLVWLTLWTPMLAIVNFLLTLFGSNGFAESIGVSGGLTMENKHIVSERANDMVIAGQFLGTMVPMITWGIVKGAMAFTEFISSGIGSQFATQAGASAATGNLSMNNLSMNSVSLDKYSTQMSSAVGFQDVKMSTSAGVGTVSQNAGGGEVLHNNTRSNVAQNFEASANKQLSQLKELSSALGTTISKEKSVSAVVSLATDTTQSDAVRAAAMQTLSHMYAKEKGISHGEAYAVLAQAAKEDAAVQTNTHSNEFGARGGVKVEGKLGLVKGDVGIHGAANAQDSDARVQGDKSSNTASNTQQITETDGEKRTNSATKLQSLMNESARTNSRSDGKRSDEGAAIKEAAQEARTQALKHSESLSAMVSSVRQLTSSESVDMVRYEALMRQHQQLVQDAGLKGLEQLQADREKFGNELNIQGRVEALNQSVDGRVAAINQKTGKATGALPTIGDTPPGAATATAPSIAVPSGISPVASMAAPERAAPATGADSPAAAGAPGPTPESVAPATGAVRPQETGKPAAAKPQKASSPAAAGAPGPTPESVAPATGAVRPQETGKPAAAKPQKAGRPAAAGAPDPAQSQGGSTRPAAGAETPKPTSGGSTQAPSSPNRTETVAPPSNKATKGAPRTAEGLVGISGLPLPNLGEAAVTSPERSISPELAAKQKELKDNFTRATGEVNKAIGTKPTIFNSGGGERIEKARELFGGK